MHVDQQTMFCMIQRSRQSMTAARPNMQSLLSRDRPCSFDCKSAHEENYRGQDVMSALEYNDRL